MCPNFLIVGTQKGGTTSLFNYLKMHPKIKMPNTKEIHYFTFMFSKGDDWYRSNFPKLEDGEITGEASPYYMFYERYLRRIYDYNRNMKIIVLLRNPIYRALSHYKMMCSYNMEKLSFSEAILKEEERIYHLIENEVEYDKPDSDLRSYSYKERGIYHKQIRNILNIFPAKNVLIIKSEDMFKYPNNILKYVFEFLGVDSAIIDLDKHIDFPTYNISEDRNLDRDFDIDENTLKYLCNFFYKHNIKLDRILTGLGYPCFNFNSDFNL
jgi:hypothetical protein